MKLSAPLLLALSLPVSQAVWRRNGEMLKTRVPPVPMCPNDSPQECDPFTVGLCGMYSSYDSTAPMHSLATEVITAIGQEPDEMNTCSCAGGSGGPGVVIDDMFGTGNFTLLINVSGCSLEQFNPQGRFTKLEIKNPGTCGHYIETAVLQCGNDASIYKFKDAVTNTFNDTTKDYLECPNDQATPTEVRVCLKPSMCIVSGDPHVKTYAGDHYNLAASGEFTLSTRNSAPATVCTFQTEKPDAQKPLQMFHPTYIRSVSQKCGTTTVVGHVPKQPEGRVLYFFDQEGTLLEKGDIGDFADLRYSGRRRFLTCKNANEPESVLRVNLRDGGEDGKTFQYLNVKMTAGRSAMDGEKTMFSKTADEGLCMSNNLHLWKSGKNGAPKQFTFPYLDLETNWDLQMMHENQFSVSPFGPCSLRLEELKGPISMLARDDDEVHILPCEHPEEMADVCNPVFAQAFEKSRTAVFESLRPSEN